LTKLDNMTATERCTYLDKFQQDAIVEKRAETRCTSCKDEVIREFSTIKKSKTSAEKVQTKLSLETTAVAKRHPLRVALFFAESGACWI
jgi:hypothetical protein